MSKMQNIARLTFLCLYALYAVTPVQMYAMGRGDAAQGHPAKGSHTSTDIVWANVLFASLFDGDDAARGLRVAPGIEARNSDVVLVTKRRALVREQLDVKPLPDTKVLPADDDAGPSRSLSNEITEEPPLRRTGRYLFLNTGLSPPSRSL